jgi:2-polyprenyl-3-methyl-5-hydroxy-6-metoxy-1,4-benzoquinol methylase
LDVGASTGFICNYLAPSFEKIDGIDIDEKAISFAKKNFHNTPNLEFHIGDAMNLAYPDQTFDVVFCAQIYEHVPNAKRMIQEIHRVLRPGGVCYFAAGNRLMLNEPHYNLLFLSILPKFIANIYLRILRRGSFYYETHLTYWGLRKLVKPLQIIDYTVSMIEKPARYRIEYLLSPESRKHKIARWIVNYAYWLCPGYVWLLKKT